MRIVVLLVVGREAVASVRMQLSEAMTPDAYQRK